MLWGAVLSIIQLVILCISAVDLLTAVPSAPVFQKADGDSSGTSGCCSDAGGTSPSWEELEQVAPPLDAGVIDMSGVGVFDLVLACSEVH